MDLITNYWDTLPSEIQNEIYREEHKLITKALFNELVRSFRIARRYLDEAPRFRSLKAISSIVAIGEQIVLYERVDYPILRHDGWELTSFCQSTIFDYNNYTENGFESSRKRFMLYCICRDRHNLPVIKV